MIVKNEESGLYEVEIDGVTYSFEKWGAQNSLLTLIKISKIIGKPLGKIVGSAITGGEGLKTQVSPDMIADACQALLENLDEGPTMDLVKKLSSEKLLCDGKKVSFDTHYQDNLMHLFKVIRASLEVQYSDFLGALLGMVKTQGPLAAKEIQPKAHAIKNHRG